MLVVSSENSGCDPLFLFLGIGVVTWLFLPLLRFCVTTSFLLSASLILSHSFSFRLRHHSVILSLQAVRDSNLLVCLFSCRDVDIRLRPSSFFNHSNSCRDLKSMSRPFLLPIQSQPHFSVSTVFIQFSISGSDLTVLPFAEIYVATSISCSDLNFMSRHHFCCQLC